MTLDSKKVEAFITAAMKYKGDKYSQPKRLEKGYSDCTSLIQKSLNDLNWNTRRSVAITTHRMGIEGDARFRQIAKSQLQRGDILWGGNYINGKWEGHVAIYLGNNKTLEARVREGVDFNKNRAYFTRVYRIVALEKALKEPTVTKKNLKGIVTATGLNVRDHDSTSGKVLGVIKKNTEIKITGQTNTNWYEIEYQGKKAYVSNAHVKIKKADEVIENVEILINNKLVKKGYILRGITYITINGKDLPVRQLFENMGARVEWIENKVKITL